MVATNFNLFRQDPDPKATTTTSSKWQGAPKLRPIGTTKVINIRDDYRWTASPKSARAEIPIIEFEEMELDLSSLITSALYKLRGGIENVAAFAQAVNDLATSVTGKATQTQLQSFDAAQKSVTSDALNPYAGMYAATPTGFRYVAPYLEPLNQNISNRWGEDQNNALNSSVGNMIKKAGEAVSNIINATNLLNVLAPGSYAETPKSFNPGSAESYVVRFPLLNTFDPTDIVKNWELCYLLTYQNLANRRSVNLLDPPVLYRVTIPGVRQSPIAYVSNLSIQHAGNIRNMDVHGSIKPIPEAYMVSITFQDLLLNSRNIFTYALDGSKVTATVEPTAKALAKTTTTSIPPIGG